MIKQNQRTLNFFLVLADAFIISLSFLCAWFLRFKTVFFSLIGGYLSMEYYGIFFILVVLPTYLILYFSFGLYRSLRTHRSVFSESTQIIKINFIALAVLVLILFIIHQPNFSRVTLFFSSIIGTVFGIVERLAVRIFLQHLRLNNKNLKHILVVGDNDLAYHFAKRISENLYLGYNIAGFIGRRENVGKFIGKSRVIGSFYQLDDILAKHDFDRVILAIPLRYYYKIEELVQSCEKVGIKAEIIPDYYKYLPAKPSVDMVDDIPIINIRYVPLDEAYNSAIKKISDIFIAIIAIIITSPIMLTTAIAIKFSSPGPIIFKQERVGYNGKPFIIYKFRSMYVQNPNEEQYKWTTKDDPRKTAVGNFIRRTSIDELPQFFNVLLGTMSVVGPRPEKPYFVNEFKNRIPKYMIKHQVNPGITGLAQINGYRGNTSIKKRIEYDIEYVENWHFGLDLTIMLKTILKKNNNAY